MKIVRNVAAICDCFHLYFNQPTAYRIVAFAEQCCLISLPLPIRFFRKFFEFTASAAFKQIVSEVQAGPKGPKKKPGAMRRALVHI